VNMIGWIAADPSDREHLESLGVVVGDYAEKNRMFVDCIVSDDALNKLEPYWLNRYIWGLAIVDEE
jgi:hypothetical protein